MDFSKNITILKDHRILTQHAKCATTFGERLKGLLGKKMLGSEEAFILSPCKSIHTFFMKFPIDVIFIDPMGEIVALYPTLAPNRITWIHIHAHSVIEASSGIIEKWGIKKGDILKFKEICLEETRLGDNHV